MADEVTRIEIVAEDKTGPGVASAKRNLTGLQSSLNNVSSGMGGISSAAAGASRSLLSLGSAAAVVGGTVAVMGLAKVAGGLIDMGRGALQSYAEFERLGMSLNALAAKEAMLTGQATNMQDALALTSVKSKELLDWIQKLAIESPFRQEDVANAFRLSMALGFNTAEAQRLTKAMLDFSTATGSGGESLERISRALGQMKTKGKLSAEEMLQLSEAGVDANAILMRAFDMTGPQLFDAMKKGAIDVNKAIEAIVSEMEKLYGGAGKNSAESMSGLLSSLSEIGEITSRDLLAGVFKAAQPYIANVVGLLTAPEFKAGIDNWSAKLGAFTTEGLESAAGTVERISSAIAPLLDAQAPAWLTTMVGLGAMGDFNFKVNIKPNVTEVTTPDGGLTVDVTANATTLTTKEGGVYSVDVAAQVVSLDSNPKDEWQPVKLVGKWEEGTIGSLIAAVRAESGSDANKVLLAAGWKDEPAAIAQPLVEGLRGYMETNPVNIGFEAGASMRESIIGALDSFSWEQYTAEWDASLATWTPHLSGLQSAIDAIVTGYQGMMQLDADWKAGTAKALFDAIQRQFNDPITTYASWFVTTLSDLWAAVQGWFTANPVTVSVQPAFSGDMTPQGMEPGYQAPIDVNKPAPEAYIDPVTGEVRYRAIGDGFFRGGLAMVGEAGPELAILPRGTQILSNRDTRALYGGNTPHFAEGTTQIPAGLRGLLAAIGLWVPQAGGPQYGPPTREEAMGWRNFQRQGTQAMQETAKATGEAFESAAKDTNDAFKSALGSVPGLFGTSQVTADQMKMAELGVPQNFADDYLRQLSDEVLNGVDWEGVDITDAANRAGIDPNLPANVILELFKNAWNDSSLFANSANLDLINQDAVKAAIEQQQKELVGKANIMQLFGITDENLSSQADALGAGLASVFGQAADTDAMKAAGVQAFAAIGEGFGDNNTAVSAVGGMAAAVTTATGTPENQTALEDAGKAAAFAYYDGWKSFMAEAAPPPPTGSTGNTAPIGPSLPPGKAVGVGYWAGGWMAVHAGETIYAPRGTAVQTAYESARNGGSTVINNYVTINRAIDEEAFLARMARRLRGN